MANTSIYNAFERMWQHNVAELETKEDKIYKQNEAPTDVEEGTLWVDLDEEGISGDNSTTSSTIESHNTATDAHSDIRSLISDLDTNKLDVSSLDDAINTALTEAKESGEFDGAAGESGKDGVSVTHSWNGTTLTVTSASGTSSADLKGDTGAIGLSGNDGYTPVRGTDYWTDADKAEMVEEVIAALDSQDGEITILEQSGGYYMTDGTWNEETNYYSKCTDYISVNAGDKFLYRGLGCWAAASVIWYGSSKDCLSYEQYNEWGEDHLAYIVTAPDGASYVRFFSFNGGSFENVILEVSRYEEETVADSILLGKKIVYDGDSICYGAGYKGGYAKLIADKTYGTYDNQALGGGRLRTLEGSSDSFHSVVDNLANLPVDGDLYCFEGGINDYWTKSVLGTFDYTNFDGELDTATVCGALETIFRYCLNNFVGKPICFVITHKIQGTAYSENSNGDSFKDYHDAMVGICEKYSIPYYDAFNKSGLNGWNTAQNNAYLTGNSAGEPDGCHPNEEGYKRYYVPQLISLFESIMPTDVTEPELPAEPSYTNVLDEVGYTSGIYLTGVGVEGSDANAVTTGYIPVTEKCTIYLKNVTMPNESSHGNRIAGYDADKNSAFNAMSITSAQTSYSPVFDSDGNLTQFYLHITGLAYIRISAWGIDETSIITVNEPIE